MKSILPENMETLRQSIFCVIDDFVAVQNEHRKNLTAGKLKGLMSWQHKRESVFNRLKQYLKLLEADSNLKNDHDFLVKLQKRMGILMEGEQSLHAKAGQQKDKIASKLISLRKGKKVLQGYSLKNNSMAPGPKFLSDRT